MCTLFFATAAVISSLALAADLPPDYVLPEPPGSFANKQPAAADQKQKKESFPAGRPLIATTYFYWYDDQTKSHVIDGDGSDALTDHPATLAGFSYRNVDWHARELADMIAAGIDVALPVYWGAPVATAPNGGFAFSNAGLPKLVAAREKLLAQGKTPPRIGMFYDTSTLQANDGGYRIDLTTEAGKKWCYGTIRNFFSLVPPQHRACIDGRPLVMLYSASYAKKVDASLLPAVRKMFKENFGTEPFIVKMADWPGEADSVYQWGGAVHPFYLDTAAIGPGYDHSAVPGREPLVRDREDGDFYRKSWAKLLAMSPESRPWLVHLETWNELHEGTDICDSREYGRKYIELTRGYAELFHARAHIVPPASPHSEIWATPVESVGLTISDKTNTDGLISQQTVAGKPAWVTRPNKISAGRYMYVNAEDNFISSGDRTVEVTIEYLDAGAGGFSIQYDSSDPALDSFNRHFRPGHTQTLSGGNTWRTLTVKLPRARFFDGTNGADLRLEAIGGDINIASVRIRRL